MTALLQIVDIRRTIPLTAPIRWCVRVTAAPARREDGAEDTGARASDQRRAHRRPRGPDVGESCPTPRPGHGELLVRLGAAGVNFIDTYHRQGLYPRELPFVPGVEGAGTVEAVGPGVEDVRPGNTVAWADGASGSYAELVRVPAARAVPVPAGVQPPGRGGGRCCRA